MPSSLLSVYSPLKGRSVPFIRVTRYCSEVSWSCHSSSVFCIFLGVSVMLKVYHATPRLLTAVLGRSILPKTVLVSMSALQLVSFLVVDGSACVKPEPSVRQCVLPSPLLVRWHGDKHRSSGQQAQPRLRAVDAVL